MEGQNNFNEIIKYTITNNTKNKTQIFGEEFVKNNENNFKIIFNNEEFNLTPFLDLSIYKSTKKTIEITLKQINKVTDISKMFYGCKELTSFPGLSKLNVDDVKNISFMFLNCSSLQRISDISNWNTSNITNMAGLFQG